MLERARYVAFTCAGEEGVRLAGLGGICAFDWCCECGGSCDGTDCAVGEGCVNGASVVVELVGLELEETCTGATEKTRKDEDSKAVQREGF